MSTSHRRPNDARERLEVAGEPRRSLLAAKQPSLCCREEWARTGSSIGARKGLVNNQTEPAGAGESTAAAVPPPVDSDRRASWPQSLSLGC